MLSVLARMQQEKESRVFCNIPAICQGDWSSSSPGSLPERSYFSPKEALMNMEYDKLKILAAFDLETTGLDPVVHDIIEIAIVPLNSDFTRAELPEFTARVKAIHPENADPESLQINGLNPFEGDDIEKVAVDIATWLSNNNIGRIDPVGHNLRFDLDFFQTKFPQLSNIFSCYMRDSMQLAIAINDISLIQTKEKVFSSVSLRNLKRQFGMDMPVQHRAIADALDAAELYRRLMTKLIINE